MPTARLFDLEVGASQTETARMDRILDAIRARISLDEAELKNEPLAEFERHPKENGELMKCDLRDAV